MHSLDLLLSLKELGLEGFVPRSPAPLWLPHLPFWGGGSFHPVHRGLLCSPLSSFPGEITLLLRLTDLPTYRWRPAAGASGRWQPQVGFERQVLLPLRNELCKVTEPVEFRLGFSASRIPGRTIYLTNFHLIFQMINFHLLQAE